MRSFQLAVVAICTLYLSSALDHRAATGQQPVDPKPALSKIDYSILAQPANANKANLTDQQRARIAEILDQRVSDLVAAEPQDRAQIVADSNSAIEALLNDGQKEALAKSLQGGKLQFNFFKQKWSAVLRWFAEQAGLSLVMDAEPPGLFTYNDTREFTPAEAIDLLNSVLLSKDFTLIRREKMLVVVDTSAGVPYDLVQQVPLEKLSEFGRFEIVTTEFPLGGRPIAAVVEAVTPLVGSHGQVVPLAAAGKLLITETAGRLKTINIVIAAVPVPKKPAPPKPPEKPPAPVFATYQAPGLDPEATTEVLKLLFPAAAIRFDPNGQVVHCHAPPAIQASVKSSVENLVQSVTGDRRPRMKSYKVPLNQISALADQVALAHPKLAIDVDTDKSRLLVVASAQDHDEVAKTLESLGVTSASPSPSDVPTDLVLYRVEPESLAAVTALLEEIIPGATIVPEVDRIAVRGTAEEQRDAKRTITPFMDRTSDRPTLSFYPLKNPLNPEMMSVLSSTVPAATISWLADSKQLSVLAKLEDHTRVSETLAQIKDAIADPQAKVIAYYPVTRHQRARFLAIQSELPADVASMLLMTDATPGEFIAWGSPDQHAQLKSLLDTLKQNEPAPIAAPRKLSVAVDAAADLVTGLQARFPTVEMVLNDYTNELYVWSDGDEFDAIRTAFQTISATMAPRTESIMIPYALENAKADAVLALLIGIRPEVNAAADTNANRILVSAPLEEHARYKSIIEQLDAEPKEPNEPVVESYVLKTIDNATAISILTPLFPEMVLNSDAANQRLVASGPRSEQIRIASTIQRIDVADQDKRMEAYQLGEADAAQVISVISQLVPTAISSANADGTQVFVWADQTAHQTIQQAMQHLTNADQKTSRTLKTYPLPKGAGSMAAITLQPVAADASLSLDANYENLIALATESEHAAIAKAVDGLQRGLGQADQKTTEVYRFTRSSPSTAYSVLTTLVPRASMAIDSTASVLVATASSDDHAKIKSVIERLEDDSQLTRSMKAYAIPKGAGSSAVSIMQPVAPEASFSLDVTYEHLIAWASESEHQAIAAAVSGLKQDFLKAKAQSTEVYRFDQTSPSAASTVIAKLVPDATVAVDLTSSALVATATAQEHELIAAVVTKLEDDPEAERMMKAYPIPRSAAANAIVIMQPVAADATLSIDSTNENLIAYATENEHQRITSAIDGLRNDLINANDKTTEVYRFLQSTPQSAYTVLSSLLPEATMAVDTSTSVLVATASADDHQTIKAVVAQIENDPKSTRTMKAYPLPKGASQMAATIMQPVATEATLSLDQSGENLIAFATADEHQAIAAAVEGLRNDLVNANDKTTEVYRFLKSTPQAAFTVLSTLIPEATLAVDQATSVLVATASSDQHEMIRSVVSQIEDDPESTRLMKAYPLPRSAASIAVSIMQPVAVDASFSLDQTEENLIVWATEMEHTAIRQAVESLRADLVNPSGDRPSVAVYPLDPELISAASLVESLDEATIDRLSVLPNVETNSLIVTGNAEAQQRFSETIETITSQLKKTNELQTEVYRFSIANPTVAVEALNSLYPDATFAVDADASVLVATATTRQHEAIAKVVRQIDTEEAMGDQTTQVYRFRRASARTVSRAYALLAPKAQIGYDTGSNVIIATASAEDHKKLKEATAKVDGRSGAGGSVKVYRLYQVDAELAASAVQAIVDSQSIEADVQANQQQNSLVVVADPQQQALIESSIRQLDSDDRRMEVFELIVNDTFQVERSVRDMYNDLPEGTRPHVGVDFSNAKLFVRGTSEQVDQIRELLVKMGEPLRTTGQSNDPNHRTIYVQGDKQRMVQQIQTVWPKLRKNQIQVFVPGNRTIRPIVPSGVPLGNDGDRLLPDRPESSDPAPADTVPADTLPADAVPADAVPQSNHRRSFPPIENAATDDRSTVNGARLVLFQQSTRAAKPNEVADDGEANRQAAEPAQQADAPNQQTEVAAPIIMVADGDNITISSDDTEALDRLESLIKAMAGSGQRGANHSNFAVFLLRNTGAADTQELLEDLFDALPFHHGGGIHETVVVSDDRLNALVVHGNRQAREMVGQLLEVLDSQGLPDPLNVYKSEIFEFQHIHVSRAMSILRNVYKPQLSPGMGKKPIEIPEGVTTTVASVLSQINASNRGPILTLDKDQTTNSMIMRAPPELRDEIRDFAQKLDQTAANQSNRSVRVIQLKQGKSALIQSALQQFIGNQPDSAGQPITPRRSRR